MENDNTRITPDNQGGMQNSNSGRNENNRILPSDKTEMPIRELSPDEDPAIINPAELASFPKEEKTGKDVDLDAERDSHLVNKRSPLRQGRNITSTDNNPDRDGFM